MFQERFYHSFWTGVGWEREVTLFPYLLTAYIFRRVQFLNGKNNVSTVSWVKGSDPWERLWKQEIDSSDSGRQFLSTARRRRGKGVREQTRQVRDPARPVLCKKIFVFVFYPVDERRVGDNLWTGKWVGRTFNPIGHNVVGSLSSTCKCCEARRRTLRLETNSFVDASTRWATMGRPSALPLQQNLCTRADVYYEHVT